MAGVETDIQSDDAVPSPQSQAPPHIGAWMPDDSAAAASSSAGAVKAATRVNAVQNSNGGMAGVTKQSEWEEVKPPRKQKPKVLEVRKIKGRKWGQK